MKTQYSIISKFLACLCLLVLAMGADFVEAQISAGGRVQVDSLPIKTANVRKAPAGSVAGDIRGSQPHGAQGKVIEGPKTASLSGTSYKWWNVDFDSGTDGWVAGDALIPVSVITYADLVPQSLTLTPTSGLAGTDVKVSFNVRNSDAGKSSATTANIRLSSSASSPRESDLLLGTVTINALNSNGQQSFSPSYKIPSSETSGQRYIWVIVDPYSNANQGKSNEDNDKVSAGFNVTKPISSQPILSVTPTQTSTLTSAAGSITLNVSNTGTGSLNYSASISSGSSWLSITSNASGSSGSVIRISYTANTGAQRSGTIRISASGATGSPIDVTVTQQAASVAALPTINAVNGGNPVSAKNGQQSIAVTGANFQISTTLIFTDPAGRVYQSVASRLTFNSSSQLTYQFDNASDFGSWKVQAKSADGQLSNLFGFTVSQPAVDKPTVTVSTPLSSTSVLNGTTSYSFSGSATAPGSTVSAVEWRMNGGNWSPASGTTSWQFTATLGVGQSKVDVRSRNAQGTDSDIATRTITRQTVVVAALEISSINDGDPVPAKNGQQSISVKGANFQASTTLIFTDPAGNPYPSVAGRLTFNSASQLTYQFDNTSDFGSWKVQAKSADSQFSNSFGFTVSPPASTARSVDYPGAIWIPAGDHHLTPKARARGDVTAIVIHTTEDTSRGAYIFQFQSPDPSIETSAHYVVRRDGSVIQMVREKDIAHHAGTPGNNESWHWNSKSIGIEVERLTTDTITVAQYQSVKNLVDAIRTRFDVPLVFPAQTAMSSPSTFIPGIVGHRRSAESGGGGDPVNWDWAYFKGLWPAIASTAPTVSISSPSSSSVSIASKQSSYTLSGSASAKGGALVAVEWRMNGESWKAASGTTSWTFLIPDLPVGPNLVEVRSRDSQGVSSVFASRTLNREQDTSSPVISKIDPVIGSSSTQSISIKGSNFAKKPVVTLSWSGRPAHTLLPSQVTWLDSNEISISINTTTTADTWTIKVANPDGKPSNIFRFNVTAPSTSTPYISHLNPNPLVASSTVQVITIKGGNFLIEPAVSLARSGQSAIAISPEDVTRVSNEELRAEVTVSSAGNWAIQVRNTAESMPNTYNFQVLPEISNTTSLLYHGVTTAQGRGMPFNNIGVVLLSGKKMMVYSCVQLYSEGVPSASSKFDVTLEVRDSGLVRLIAAKPFNSSNAKNENGDSPTCSGAFETSSNTYRDILMVDGKPIFVDLKLTNAQTMEFELVEALEHESNGVKEDWVSPLARPLHMTDTAGFFDPLYDPGNATHLGTDYSAKGGDVVFAIQSGTVTYCKNPIGRPDQAAIVVRNDDGSQLVYGHVASALFQEKFNCTSGVEASSARVKQGELIGTILKSQYFTYVDKKGVTKRACHNSHLHLGYNEDQRNVPHGTDSNMHEWGWGRGPISIDLQADLQDATNNFGWRDVHPLIMAAGSQSTPNSGQFADDPC